MSGQPRILVADGTKADRDLAVLLLANALPDHEVEGVGDPLALAERLTYPDLAAVVTDCQLGWTSGADLVATIGRLHPRCAVLLFTAESTGGVLAEAVKNGVDGLLIKGSSGFLALPGAVRGAIERAANRHATAAGGAPDRALVAELEERAAQLARSNADLQQYSYVISHDLQEPLQLITRYAQLLAERHGTSLPPEAHRALAYVMTSAARMQAMINDVLEYARAGTSSAPFVPIAFDTAVASALANLKAAIDESGATVTVQRMPLLAADARQITQVFQNLIGNAIKFRRGPGPHVQITATEIEDRWVFAVSDDGIGIPHDQQGRLFGMFQRLHTATEYPGTGIGLAVCKRIVERHGGTVWVTSQPGEGSTFYFSIPKRPTAARESECTVGTGGNDGRQTAARSAR